MKVEALSLVLVAVGVLGMLGCGDDAGGGGGSGGSSGSSETGSGSGDGDGGRDGDSSGSSSNTGFVCCIGDAKYACPSDAALDQCAGFDVDGCFDDCFGDFDCEDACFDSWEASEPDPSACEEDDSVDCGGAGSGTSTTSTSGSGPTSGPTSSSTGGTCSDLFAGCDYDEDCCSTNCTNSVCEANTAGSPCDYDDDCSSDNCTGGICEDNNSGAPCDYDKDCESMNCFDGTCQ